MRKNVNRKGVSWIALVLISASLLLAAAIASAEVYPNKAVKAIIPWETGGATDLGFRAVLSAWDKFFPQPVVIVNKPGAGGVIGTAEALRAKPDGYTILCNSFGPFVTQPFLQKVPYTAEDYVTVIQLNTESRILCAHPSAPFNDLKEMMKFAKANPGKIKVGFSGIGTTGHLAMVQLAQDFGVDFNLVPFVGGGPTKTALLGGHVDISPLNPPEAVALLAGGQIKALATMGEKRLINLPQISTSLEQGYPVESLHVTLVAVPRGTPPDRIKIIHDGLKKCMEDKTVQVAAEKMQMCLDYQDGQGTQTQIQKFSKIYDRLIQQLGLNKK